MNKIVVNFTPCSPAPARGYDIMYRVSGTSDDYTDAGNFFTTPAVFYDTINPAGTCYEGFMKTDCGAIFGNVVPFETCISGVPDPTPRIGQVFPKCRSNGTCNDNSQCDVEYSITTVNAPVGSYLTINQTGGSAFVSIFDSNPASGVLKYSEANGFQFADFDVELRDSGGAIIDYRSMTLYHQSFWLYLKLCP